MQKKEHQPANVIGVATVIGYLTIKLFSFHVVDTKANYA